MATLQASDLADLVTTTLNELGEMKMTDLMSDYQDTIGLKRLVKKNKMTFKAGPKVKFNAITDDNGSFRDVGLYEIDQVDTNDTMITGEIPFRHQTWNWAVDQREAALNRSPRMIVDLVKTKRYASFASAIKGFEYRIWRTPASGDTKTFYGLPYYIVKSDTDATYANNDGFNGALPATESSTVAGINPTTYTRWKNYATRYISISKDDLIRKMRRAAVKTNWKPLVDQVPTYNLGDDYGFYTNYSVIGTMEEILESQNENLGSDIAPKDGQVLFRRTPMTYAVELEKDTTNPVYGVNWGEIHMVGLSGFWMKETVIPVSPGQHLVSQTHTDCTCNLICRNRRRNFVLSTATTMGY